MKKRITCLFLAIIMLLGTMLTGCTLGQGETTGPTGPVEDDAAYTLSMYVVCQKPVSEETAKVVNKAFSNITKSTFKTNVVLHFLTYDEYYSTIENKIKANDEHLALAEEAEKAFRDAKKMAKAEGVVTDKAWEDSWYNAHPDYIEFRETEELTGSDTTAEETVLETVEDAEGFTISAIKYPEEKDFQLDIIWIDSYDRYKDYIEKEWLERLDDELNGGSKKLKEYISPTLLQWVKWAGEGTYAIPNNCAIGEYTYLLLNKEYMDKYHYDPADFTDILSLKPEDAESADSFVRYINDVAKYENDVVPILGEIPMYNTVYWSYNTEKKKIDYNTFSLVGDTYSRTRTMDPTVSTNNATGFKTLFKSETFTNRLINLQKLKDAGCVVSEEAGAGKKYAARVVKGGRELEAEYGDDYYMAVLEYPRIQEENLFSSMFAVTTFTRSLTRSMEIVTYLNTNSKLRNVLQYGVEGVHYKLDQNGVVQRLNNDYMMNLRDTGNEFVAYPEEGMRADIWDYGKKQNLDIKAGMIIGFRVYDDFLIKNDKEDQVLMNVKELEKINSASAEIYAKLLAVKNLEELQALIELAGSTAATEIRNQGRTSTENSLYSIYYNTWMSDVNLYVPIEEG